MYSLYFMWGCHCFYASSVDSIKKYMHIYVHICTFNVHIYAYILCKYFPSFIFISMFMHVCVTDRCMYVYTTVFNILNYLLNFACLLNVISPPTTMAICSTISAPPCHSLFPWLAYWPVPQRRDGKRRKNRERRSSKHLKYLSPHSSFSW